MFFATFMGGWRSLQVRDCCEIESKAHERLSLYGFSCRAVPSILGSQAMRLYVNHSMSAPSNPETTPIISPETEHLLQLLKRWPRQRLSRWLLENGDIEDKLIARRVPEDLKRRPVKQDGPCAGRGFRYRCHRL